MDRQAVLAADAAPQLGASRAHVLDLLRAAGAPLGVREVAGQAGLHPNTARFHLDGLAGAGLAVRTPQPRTAPGRPSMMYRAVPETAAAGERRYRLLAEMLATMITGLLPDTAPAATEAGREWGRYLADPPAPGQRTDATSAVAQLAAILEQAGFDPDQPAASQAGRSPTKTGPEAGSGCGAARSRKWRASIRTSSARCTWDSCRAPWSSCALRSPPAGSSRSRSPACASPTSAPLRSSHD